MSAVRDSSLRIHWDRRHRVERYTMLTLPPSLFTGSGINQYQARPVSADHRADMMKSYSVVWEGISRVQGPVRSTHSGEIQVMNSTWYLVD